MCETRCQHDRANNNLYSLFISRQKGGKKIKEKQIIETEVENKLITQNNEN